MKQKDLQIAKRAIPSLAVTLILSLSLGCREEKTDPQLDPHSASATAKEGGAAQTATSNNPGVPQQLQLRETPPKEDEFTAGHKVIKLSPGRVEVFDASGQLVTTSTNKFFTDPSGAVWMYKTMGGADKGKDAWAIKGDIPSKLEGYALVFETDFRNPNKNTTIVLRQRGQA